MTAGGASIARRGRLSVAGRVVLAAGGGYGLAALATALLSLALPLARPEAVAAATLLGFLLMPAVAVVVFAVRSLRRAALIVAGSALILGGLLGLAMRSVP